MSARERIGSARLYLVCDARPRAFLDAALRGGVDVIQLRDKTLADGELVAAAREFRAAADAAGALFVLNDRPDLVEPCGADGVHVGQDDGSVADARAVVGPERIVGRSTHAPAQGAAADADPDVDYLAVGPVHATPTKPGRPAAGLEYVEWAAANVTKPWFAIGGLDAENVGDVTARGARRIVVVRAIADAADPEAAARALRAAVGGARWGSAAVSDEPRGRAAARPAARSPATNDHGARGYARGRERDARASARARAARARRAPARRHDRGDPRRSARRRERRAASPPATRSRRAAARSPASLVFAGLMATAAIGMWRVRYWAVLGFEALLGIAIVFAALSLMRRVQPRPPCCCASRSSASPAPLFWFLIRAMARIQLPARRPREPVG